MCYQVRASRFGFPINPFIPSAPLLQSLKGCIENKWVKLLRLVSFRKTFPIFYITQFYGKERLSTTFLTS